VATEVVDFMKREKKSEVLFKVDSEKAYDSVDWKFLYYMMGRLGFNERWIKWIRACLESATVSILVNGSPIDEFKPKRGLRQGDPLAPFLFLIVVEGMTGLVREASRKKLLKGIEVGYRGVQIQIFQFADDMSFFCQPTYHNMLVIKTILRCFELCSGLRVNFHKSHAEAVGVNTKNLKFLAKCINYPTMELPFKYLGMIVGGNPRRERFWIQ